MPMLPLYVSLAAFLVAVIVINRFRARRIGDQPFCTACRFDLSGLARTQPDQPARSDGDFLPAVPVCPECGADLRRCGAITRGRVVGLSTRLRFLSYVVLLAVMVLVHYRLGGGSAGRPSLPDWALRLEARTFGTDAAVEEIVRRIRAGTWATSGNEPLVPAAIRRLGKTPPGPISHPTPWWDLFAAAVETGMVSDEQLVSYVESQMTVTAHAPESMSSAGPLVHGVSTTFTRPGPQPGVYVRAELARFVLDAHDFGAVTQPSVMSTLINSSGGGTWRVPRSHFRGVEFTPGATVTLESDWRITIHRGDDWTTLPLLEPRTVKLVKPIRIESGE